MIEKRTQIIVTGQAFTRIEALLVLDRKMVSERENLRKLAGRIESQQKILQNPYYEQKFKSQLKSIDEKISQVKSPVLIRNQFATVESFHKKFEIKPPKKVTLNDVKKRSDSEMDNED